MKMRSTPPENPGKDVLKNTDPDLEALLPSVERSSLRMLIGILKAMPKLIYSAFAWARGEDKRRAKELEEVTREFSNHSKNDKPKEYRHE